MIARNYSDVRNNLKKYCDVVTNDFETIIVTRERGENVVMLSETEYNNIMENLAIFSNTKYYNSIIHSINQLKKGEFEKRDLLDE